ncbi:MAG TPA: hypothetical protein VIR77_00985 [Pontiella sp.]
MMLVSKREFMLIASFSVMAHLFLFIAFRVSAQGGHGSDTTVPLTRYSGSESDTPAGTQNHVRTVQSPVIFSLPSVMGFSRDLLSQKARTRLVLSQPKQTEEFLTVDPLEAVAVRISRDKLMVSTAAGNEPRPPGALIAQQQTRPAARRVSLAPALKERLIGGVVLPAELNQPSARPWEAHASVSISENGAVTHVFLDQPLESSALNQQVLKLLHSLRFKAGPAVDGSIEIYSPETASRRETER